MEGKQMTEGNNILKSLTQVKPEKNEGRRIISYVTSKEAASNRELVRTERKENRRNLSSYVTKKKNERLRSFTTTQRTGRRGIAVFYIKKAKLNHQRNQKTEIRTGRGTGKTRHRRGIPEKRKGTRWTLDGGE